MWNQFGLPFLFVLTLGLSKNDLTSDISSSTNHRFLRCRPTTPRFFRWTLWNDVPLSSVNTGFDAMPFSPIAKSLSRG